jgi:hypothetical protein
MKEGVGSQLGFDGFVNERWKKKRWVVLRQIDHQLRILNIADSLNLARARNMRDRWL